MSLIFGKVKGIERERGGDRIFFFKVRLFKVR
jgi:hypothetical protein